MDNLIHVVYTFRKGLQVGPKVFCRGERMMIPPGAVVITWGFGKKFGFTDERAFGHMFIDDEKELAGRCGLGGPISGGTSIICEQIIADDEPYASELIVEAERNGWPIKREHGGIAVLRTAQMGEAVPDAVCPVYLCMYRNIKHRKYSFDIIDFEYVIRPEFYVGAQYFLADEVQAFVNQEAKKGKIKFGDFVTDKPMSPFEAGFEAGKESKQPFLPKY